MNNKKEKKKVSLRIKLVVIICCTIIPLNIIVFFLGNQLIKNTNAQLEGNYSRELSNFAEHFNQDINQAELSILSLFDDFRPELEQIVHNENTNISAFRVWKELRKFRTQYEIVDAFYLTIYDEEVFMAHNSEHLKNDDVQKLKNTLKDFNWIQDDNGFIETLSCNDEEYLVGHFEYGKYALGYLIKLKTITDQVESQTANLSKAEIVSQGSDSVLSSNDIAIESDIIDGKYIIRWEIEGDQGINRARLITVLLVLLIIVIFVLIPILLIVIRRMVLTPMREVLTAIDEVKNENLKYEIKKTANTPDFNYLFESFNGMIMELDTLHREKYESQLEKLSLESDNLRLQVNPHLLLNSFNMIYNMARSCNYEIIQKYTLHLVNYFRYALKQTGTMVRLQEEIAFVSEYLSIQEIRYPDAFESEINVASECKDMSIPPLLVENFVENAIKYGRVAGQKMKVWVDAVVSRDENETYLIITIKDNGVGFDPEILKKVKNGELIVDELGKTHIGIDNCRRRLKLFYGEKAGMDIESIAAEGTRVTIRINQATPDGEEENA